MDDFRLENAFRGVPPAVHARVLNTLQEVKTVKKAKPVAALALAAVLMMALAGAAYAAVQSGVLDFVFQRSEPSREQRDMVQPVGLVHESDGIVTTVTDALLDGRELSVGLTFDSAKNFYIITDSVTVNGAELFMNDSNIVNMWLKWPYEENPGLVSRGFTGTVDAEYFWEEAPGSKELAQAAEKRLTEEGIADVRIHLTLLAPKQELAYIDTNRLADGAAWRQINACVAAGNTPVDKESGYVWVDGTWLEENAWLKDGLKRNADGGYSWTDGEAYAPELPAGQYPIGDAQAHIRHSNMRVLDSFEMAFTLSASAARDVTPAKALENDDYSVVFDEVSFTPISSTFAFRIYPKGMSMEDVVNTFQFFEFYDENKQPVSFQDTFAEGSSGQMEDAAAYEVIYKMPAMETHPGTIYLVPYNESSGAEHPLWEYAIAIDCQ